MSDAGPRIPEADLLRVFRPILSTDAERYGAGLGLAIVKSVVESLGGSVSVTSVLGEGTRFLRSFAG